MWLQVPARLPRLEPLLQLERLPQMSRSPLPSQPGLLQGRLMPQWRARLIRRGSATPIRW